MNKLIKFALVLSAVFCLSSQALASTDYFVRTDRIENNVAKEIKIFGTTASTTPPGSSVEVYFEYGTDAYNFNSSSSPQTLPTLPLDAQKNSTFSATITNAVPGIYNYFRAVRKTSFSSPARIEYEKGGIFNVTPLFENMAPQILAIVPFNGPACELTACAVTIPENFSRAIPVATVYTRDANSDQNLSLSIKDGNTNNAFYINLFGELKVSDLSAIDYEKIHSFDLKIEVKDNGIPQKSNLVNLKVNITDVATENGTESTYSSNNTNSTYITDGNTGGSNKIIYFSYPPSNGPTYQTGSSRSSTNTNTNYNIRYTNGPTYGSLDGGSGTFGANNSGGATYNSGTNVNNNLNYNQNNTTNYSNTEQVRQALIQTILAQLVLLRAELAERIRLGLP